MTQEEKIKKLKTLLEMVDESLTRKEFVDNFKQVIDFIKSAKKDLDQNISQKLSELEKSFKELSNNSNSELASEKEKLEFTVSEYLSSLSKKQEKLSSQFQKELSTKIQKKVDEKLSTLKDGKDADEGKIIGTIISMLPEYKEKPEETPEMIRNKLEGLIGDNRLDKSAIKGLEERIAELESKITSSRSRGGMRKIPIVKRYRLTDQCNGVLKSFTLPADTTDVLGVFGTQFPVNYDPYNSSGGDWTFTGRTLTLGDAVPAPETGQTLWCLIETLFY